jgi:aspartate aminotransferase-like enzyme
VAELVRELQPDSALFVDAMSSFGAIPLSLANVDFLVSSANKCLEGIPGFAYALCRKKTLDSCKGYFQ